MYDRFVTTFNWDLITELYGIVNGMALIRLTYYIRLYKKFTSALLKHFKFNIKYTCKLVAIIL